MPTGLTLVTASRLSDSTGALIANARISFQPVSAALQPTAFLAGTSPTTPIASDPVAGSVVNGVLCAPISVTAATTSGSLNVTLSAAANLQPGSPISGPGIPSGATVASGSGTAWVLATGFAATATASAVTLVSTGIGITLADPNLTPTLLSPPRVGYAVTCTDNVSGCVYYSPATGYGYVYWPTGTSFDFDTYVPAPASPGIISFVGPAGANGTNGTNGSDGPPVTFRGAYASGTTYAIGDAVSENGSSYISLQAANTGHDPASSPTWWGVLAAAGAAGSSGVTGTGTFCREVPGGAVNNVNNVFTLSHTPAFLIGIVRNGVFHVPEDGSFTFTSGTSFGWTTTMAVDQAGNAESHYAIYLY